MSDAPLSIEKADQWFSRKEAANFLTSINCPTTPGTLSQLAANGNRRNGPKYFKNGLRICRYRESDLRAWAAARLKEIC